MHENEISEKIIDTTIEEHCIFKPVFLESVYEDALCHELHLGSNLLLRVVNDKFNNSLS